MSDRWTERLSEYLDGGLEETERVALTEHLRVCDECIAVLHDLRRVVASAGALEDRPPKTSLWTGIATRIGRAAGGEESKVVALSSRRRLSFSVPQLLAAGIALMVLSGGAVWLALGGAAAPAQPIITARNGGPAVAPRPVVQTDQYDATVVELEHLLQRHREQLDPATVEALVQSLSVIDGAIEEARAALAADPANAYLNSHLAQTMRRKIHLLSRAAALVRAAT